MADVGEIMLVQKFKWYLYVLLYMYISCFLKKLSEKQRVFVLILFLAVFLFVKGCRSVIFLPFKNGWFVDFRGKGFLGWKYLMIVNTILNKISQTPSGTQT